MILRTERLILRGPRPSDLDDLFAIYSNPNAMRYWSTAPHATKSVTHERLDRMIAAFQTNPVYFCIVRNGQVIGNAGMVPDSEVGFILHPSYHRQGIVSEAMEAIIPYLWSATEVGELTADADPLNDASRSLLQSLGFQETHRAARTFCINGIWSDSVYFALQRPS